MNNKMISLLLIEDDKVDQMAFERYIKKNDLPYDYSIAGSVSKAKAILESKSFDLIISDYLLGDGIAFELFEFFKGTPVVVTTGSGDEEIAVEAMKLGAYDYLIKDPEGNYLKILPETVKLALNRKQNELQLQEYHDRLETMVMERTSKLQAEIAERKKAEKALLESEAILKTSEARFRKMIEKSPLPMVITDSNQNIIHFNDKFTELFGYTLEDISTAEEWWDNAYPDSNYRLKVQQSWMNAIETAKATNTDIEMQEWELTIKDGTQRSCEFYMVPLDGFSLKVIKDLTQQKQIEAEKINLKLHLQQSQKMEALGTLAGGIAHDFNNILTSIIGYSDLAMGDVEKGSDLEDDLQEIHTAGLRAKELVKQILTIARQSDEELSPLRVDSVAKEVIKFIRASIPTTIEIKSSLKSKALILGNETQVHQIFMNLFTNASHAMEKNGGLLEVKLEDININGGSYIKHPDLKPGNYIRLKVSDTGTGIPQHVMDSIFEPYFTTKAQGKGTGLGLAMVHGIVRSYGGSIIVSSELKKGSVFTIYLPVTQKFKNRISPELDRYPKGTEKILLIDDELSIVKLNQRILETLGYQVTTKTCSVKALEYFKSNPKKFDLVITDMTMPKMTGDKLAKEMTDIVPDLPIILCTGYTKKLSDNFGKNKIITAVLKKPTPKIDLAETIRKVLDESKDKPQKR